MNLTPLAGNGPLKRRLALETARHGLSHAYILSGPPGVGKHTLAGLLCAALVCRQGGGEAPCLTCPDCRKALAGIHPDVIRAGEPDKDLTVGHIRALRSDAYIRPNQAKRKVYLLEGAHTMNASAQNAMLKLLEEGPAYAAFLLLTSNAAALLPTVRSRCQTLTLAPVSQQEAEAWLSARFPDKPAQAVQAAARRCQGLLGRAVAELEGSDAADQAAAQAAGALLARLGKGDELALAQFCVGLEKWDREGLTALLDELILLLRDSLASAAGLAGEEQDPARRALAQEAAGALSPAALSRCAALAETLRTACGSNVGAGHLAGWLCAGLWEARGGHS